MPTITTNNTSNGKMKISNGHDKNNNNEEENYENQYQILRKDNQIEQNVNIFLYRHSFARKNK